MTEFLKVSEKNDIKLVAELAYEVWHEHYDELLGPRQVDYMTEKFQSEKAVLEQLSEGYEYYIIKKDGQPAGYVGIRPEKDGKRLFLSKLYIKKGFRGQRLSSEAFDYLENICRERGYASIWLTVNKYNADSIAVYKHRGFKIFDSQVTDIGEGYVMDDYFMEKEAEGER